MNCARIASLLRELADEIDPPPEKPARRRGPGAFLDLSNFEPLPPPNDIERAEIRRRLRGGATLKKRDRR